MKICSIESCERKIHAKELCAYHYTKSRRGPPKPKRERRKRRSNCIEFLKSIKDTTSNECIIWPFYTKADGYGVVNIKGKTINAHRASLSINQGIDPPASLTHCCHKPFICTSRACVNPNHLYWCTCKQNIADIRIHTGSHVNSKLTDNQVSYILLSSLGIEELSKMFEVSRTCIYDILKGKSYKHVERPPQKK